MKPRHRDVNMIFDYHTVVWHTLDKLEKQFMYMFQLHKLQEARKEHSGNDITQRGQRKQQREAAAASRHKPQSRSSNIPRDAPSQAASARKLTQLQRCLLRV